MGKLPQLLLAGLCLGWVGLLVGVAHGQPVTFAYEDGRFSIEAYQVPLKDVLERIAREARADIYIIKGKKDRTIDLSVKEETATDVLRILMREQSYAVVYNVGRAGSVHALEDIQGTIPLRAAQPEEDYETVSIGSGEESRELSKREEEIQRLEHFIANLKRRIESGKSDELYDKLIKERDPETVTHDREKLERLQEKLEDLRYSE